MILLITIYKHENKESIVDDQKTSKMDLSIRMTFITRVSSNINVCLDIEFVMEISYANATWMDNGQAVNQLVNVIKFIKQKYINRILNYFL